MFALFCVTLCAIRGLILFACLILKFEKKYCHFSDENFEVFRDDQNLARKQAIRIAA